MIWRIVFGAVAVGGLVIAYSIGETAGFAFGLLAGLCGEALRS